MHTSAWVPLKSLSFSAGGGRACRLEDFDTSHFRGQDPGMRNALVVVLSLAGGGGIK